MRIFAGHPVNLPETILNTSSNHDTNFVIMKEPLLYIKVLMNQIILYNVSNLYLALDIFLRKGKTSLISNITITNIILEPDVCCSIIVHSAGNNY